MTSFEDKISEAIIARFFEPIPTFTQVSKSDGNGNYYLEWQVGSHKSPVAVVAAEIYAAKGKEIVEAVLRQMTVEQIGEVLVPKIVADLVEKLGPSNRYSSFSETERTEMRKLVWKRVADEYGKRAVEYLQNSGALSNMLGSVVEEASDG